MTRRRAPGGNVGPPQTPIDEAMIADEAHVAEELAGILEATKGFEVSQIKGNLYQKPQNGQGPWSWCDDVYPPWNLSQIFQDMRERFGPGFYQLRIYANGKIRKNVDFSIAKEKTTLAAAPSNNAQSSQFSDMLLLMMQNSRDAADRQMNMMQAMSKQTTDLLAAILPAMAGGGGNRASETVALIAALKDAGGSGGGIKDTLEAMAAFKTLLGHSSDDGEGRGEAVDLDDLAGTAVRLIGPGVKALGDYLQRSRDPAASEGGAPSANGTAAPGAGGQLALGAPPSRHPLLDLVRDDVNYMFKRGFDPAKAADLVYDIIVANEVAEEEINALATLFALSPNGLEDLAREGIDFRSAPGWANAFFAELVAIHRGERDDPAGPGGGQADVAENGSAGAVGI